MLKHYPIGGSTAKTWTKCAAAPWLSLCAPEVKENDAMARGTRIHAYAEDMLKGRAPSGAADEVGYARRYANALLGVAGCWAAEWPVRYNDMVGTTIDAVTTGGGVLRIVDLKTGQEPVDPRNNLQLLFSLMCYVTDNTLPATVALGIYQELDDGSAPLRWWVMSGAEADARVMEMSAAVDLVMVGGAPTPGKHCDRCRARGVCGSAANTSALMTSALTPAMMSPAQAASAMALFPRVRKWMDGVEEAWEDAAKAGQLPGITAKPRKSPLKWATADLPDAWCEKKPMTPTQVVKGGHASEAELINKGLAVRPPDGFTLVYLDAPVAVKTTAKADF